MDELTDEQKQAIEAELREKLQSELRGELEEDFKKQYAAENKETLDKLVDEQLSKMKENVNKAYSKLDEITKENLRMKEAQKDAERKRMEEEGKHLELREMEVTELREQLKILQEKNTSLDRDQRVKDAIAGLEFRNDFARETMFDRVTRELVHDDERGWVHKSGSSIDDYIKVFSKDEKYRILFKEKDNSGTGTPLQKSGNPGQRTKPMKDMSTQELLELAERGELGSIGF